MDDRAPLVSIVTPSFNQSEFLEATIQSVLEQDYSRIEYILMDGGSTDGSLDIIQRYADRLAFWLSEPDLGQTDAINKGFARSEGDILAWLNSDDLYDPWAVSEAVEFLSRNPEVGMVYGAAYYIDELGNVIARYPARQTDYKRLRRGVATIPQQASFFRSKLWDQVGPLDPSFYYAMDYDLWVRISARAPIAFVDTPWAKFRLHGESKSLREAYRCWPEMVRVHFRNGGSRFSVLYGKYLLRRLVEPLMPWRMKARIWRYKMGGLLRPG